MKPGTRIGIVATLGVGVFLSTAIAGGIVGSKHDFSLQSWADSEICKPCHTPHNADISIDDAPLWNHELTNATYQLYTSPTLIEQVDQPGPSSRLCMSCHDGTVAMDSFGGAAGTHYMTGEALIGTDLRNDHPVGIRWRHQTGSLDCISCHDVSSGGDLFSSELPFYDAKVECATCHEPHNSQSIDGMLRMSNNASRLCLYCHNPT